MKRVGIALVALLASGAAHADAVERKAPLSLPMRDGIVQQRPGEISQYIEIPVGGRAILKTSNAYREIINGAARIAGVSPVDAKMIVIDARHRGRASIKILDDHAAVIAVAVVTVR